MFTVKKTLALFLIPFLFLLIGCGVGGSDEMAAVSMTKVTAGVYSEAEQRFIDKEILLKGN